MNPGELKQILEEGKGQFVEFKEKIIKEGWEKSSVKGSEKSSEKILLLIRKNPEISAKEIAGIIGISSRSVEKHLAKLKERELLKRIGSAKGGHWEIIG